MLLNLVKSPIIACNCTLRNFPDLVFGRVAHLNWEYSSSGFMQDLFSGVHIYHISTEIKESVIDILTNHIMLYSPDIDEIHITLDGGRVYKVCTSSDPFC